MVTFINGATIATPMRIIKEKYLMNISYCLLGSLAYAWGLVTEECV